MSVYENKGLHGATAIVARDGSGNFNCNGTNDHVDIEAAIDWVGDMGGGKVLIKEGTYDIGAQIDDQGKDNIELWG